MTPQDKQKYGEAGNITIPSGSLILGDFCEVLVLGSTAFTTLTDSLEKPISEYGTYASGTLTFTDAPIADETIEVNSTTYTFKASASAPTEITIGTGANAAAKAASTAANVVAKVAADTAVTVTSALGVVTVTSAVIGTAGNAITLGESATNCTKSGATLAGGNSIVAAKTITYPAGTKLRGKFTAVQPASASVRCTLSSPRQ